MCHPSCRGPHSDSYALLSPSPRNTEFCWQLSFILLCVRHRGVTRTGEAHTLPCSPETDASKQLHAHVTGFQTMVPSCARFAPVAEQWFRLLVTDAEAPRHGLDLFGRDSLVLGKCTSQPDSFPGSFQCTSSILIPHPTTKHDAATGPDYLATNPWSWVDRVKYVATDRSYSASRVSVHVPTPK